MAKASQKKVEKKTTRVGALHTDEDSELEDEMVAMLKEEFGDEDSEVLKLVEQIEKNPSKETEGEEEESPDDDGDFRRCPNCGLDSLFIEYKCSDCGYDLKKGEKDDMEMESGYNEIEDE